MMPMPASRSSVDLATLPVGFRDPVGDSQRAYRAILGAMSRPGTVVSLGLAGAADDAGGRFEHPPIVGPALAAALLTLADRQTPVWLSPRLAAHPTLPAFARFHTGCPLVDEVPQAALLFCAASDAATFDFDAVETGTDESPHLGATVVIDVQALSTGLPLTLSGPGIETRRGLRVALPADRLWQGRVGQNELFPRGVDLLLACGERLAAIPRSTRLEIG